MLSELKKWEFRCDGRCGRTVITEAAYEPSLPSGWKRHKYWKESCHYGYDVHLALCPSCYDKWNKE